MVVLIFTQNILFSCAFLITIIIQRNGGADGEAENTLTLVFSYVFVIGGLKLNVYLCALLVTHELVCIAIQLSPVNLKMNNRWY